jgi:hypothetical protein
MLTYDKTYHFEGTEEQLATKLNNNKWKDVYCHFHQSGYYEISSLISIGSANFGKLINLHLIHQPTNPHNQQVNISFTYSRLERFAVAGL